MDASKGIRIHRDPIESLGMVIKDIEALRASLDDRNKVIHDLHQEMIRIIAEKDTLIESLRAEIRRWETAGF
jgi:hypothetical protein